ncbi:MAG: M48 family metallopeptidase, partial [Phycisphaerales bacterium]|nr:M48 family metallopeptidase [Phycisphaerales bacterium]
MFLFIIAVLLIMAIVIIPIGLVSEWNEGAVAIAAIFCVLIVGISALVKLAQLNDGGLVVAEMLGGTALQPSGGNRAERKVRNIVEEMAIASGMPVPPVYLLEDDSINAFAAGWTPSDAVIGVTRGCIEKLNRDELQGVIAHEFSHISHGDMRINIRLIGVIFGIMALGISGWVFVRYIGPAILHSSSRSRSKEGAGGAGIALAIILFGLFLVVCGAVGTFFGRLIQAAVSRQREFLADSSAVQYTRNPFGIGSALRKIGGIPQSGSISKDAGQCNHMFFSQAVSSLFASHPPITERVARVEGIDVASLPATTAVNIDNGSGDGVVSGFSSEVVRDGVQEAGVIRENYIERASLAIKGINPTLRESLNSGWSARLVMIALLVDTKQPIQKTILAKVLTVQELVELKTIIPLIAKVDRASILPMVDLAAPALRLLSAEQQMAFAGVLNEVAKSDNTISRFEWVIISVIHKHLANNKLNKISQNANKKLTSVLSDAAIVLGALSYSGAEVHGQAKDAFKHGMQVAGLKVSPIPKIDLCAMEEV